MTRRTTGFSGKLFNHAVADMGIDDTASATVIAPGGGDDFYFTHGMQDLSLKMSNSEYSIPGDGLRQEFIIY